MCLLCFSKEPLSSDEVTKGQYGAAYGQYINDTDKFQITMCQTPCKEPACWIGTMLCFWCSQVAMRKKVLNHVAPGSGWDNYVCCQGFYGGCCCFQPGNLGEKTCPVTCMCLESCLCPGPAASATSLVLREKHNLGLDEDDVRLIRCNNCLYCTSIVLSCMRICIQNESLDFAAHCARCTSDVVFLCTAGCMLGQAQHEIKFREEQGTPVVATAMER